MNIAARILPVVAVLGALGSAQAVTVNFDEFTSPPITCCYGNPSQGVPVVYPTVTITGGTSGTIMNGSGWNNLQTSGENLYGTLDGSMLLAFNQATSGLSLDVINGTGAAPFTVSLYDASSMLLATSTVNLPNWGGPSGIAHFSFATSGVYSATVTGNSDFAIDTIQFAPVPEPETYALMLAGLAAVGAMVRRQRRA